MVKSQPVKSNDISKWYDGLVDRWQENYSSAGNRHFLSRVQNVKRLVRGLDGRSKILDVGCGTGDITQVLHDRYGCLTIGVDVSKNMIGYCSARRKTPKMVFHVSDFRHLPYSNDMFDLVLSVSVLEWIEDYRRAISEVARVLKSGGQWVVSLPNWQSPLRKIEGIKNAVFNRQLTRYQKNRLTAGELKTLAMADGLRETASLFHVMPFYYENLAGRAGKLFGMMCMLSMKKQ